MMLLRVIALLAVGASVVVPTSTPAVAQTCAPQSPPSAISPVRPVAGANPLATTETSIHWTRASAWLTYGDSALLEGQVVTEEGAVTDADVDLYERRSGTRVWTRVASATSDPDTGIFAFGCLLPEWTTTYRVTYAGTLTHSASSGNRQVEVARNVPDSMHRVSSSRFAYSGSVDPRYVGRVTLQRRACTSCDWQGVASDATDDRSRWRFTIDVSRLRGKPAYRATIPADGRFRRSFSQHVWRITVS